ncbi:MAG TPA: HAMP domain-containing protein [bacterium]|jgi:signal transduction histidine kinase|nr:HAMP domain-containing protein [bacterium]
MSLRNRIMLLVAIGLLIATIPLGVMGLGMVRAATDQVLDERLSLTRAMAHHLGRQLAQGWSRLDQISLQLGAVWSLRSPQALQREFTIRSGPASLFSGGLFLADRVGTVLAPAPASSLRTPVLVNSPTLAAVFRTRKPQSSGIERSVDGHPIVFLVVPIVASGDIVAAAGGVIDLSEPTLLAFISGVIQGASGHAAIVARDGRVLASTDEDELFTRNEHPDFFARFIAGGRPIVGSARENHGPGVPSEMHVMAFAPVATVPWGLGIGQTEDETFGPIRRLRDRVIAFELIVLVAAVLFAWIDTSAVAAPLAMLRAASERIAEGDLEYRIDVRRGDEIGSLARSFETMRQQLRRSLDENAQLQERLQSVAVVEERERIAREMHDSVGQVLGYVNTKAQAVTALLETGRVAEAQTQLTQLELAARGVYRDLREAILGLRATTGSGGQLVPVVTEYADRFAALSGVDVRVEVDGDPARYAFSATAELHLLRIIQEALTNIRKHAGARSALVHLSTDGGAALVTIADDGVGFPFTDRSTGHRFGFGLQTMRERAEAVGGTLTISSRAGGGTEVQVRLGPEGRDARARAAG